MKKISPNLIDHIARCCEGLVYISETDAPIKVFTSVTVEALDPDTMRAITNTPGGTHVEERGFTQFFERLTKTEPWHDEQHRVQTKKFLELKGILEENLRDLKVFKIGEIRLTIYAVGLDRHNNVVGIKTEAVET